MASSNIVCIALVSAVLLGIALADVERKCLDCICKVESNCKRLGCHKDGPSDSCGYYQIKLDYYKDCGQPEKKSGESINTAFERCARDKGCAEKCVQAYMKRYAARCKSPPTCEVYARVHNGGPLGCRSSSTLPYWRKVQACL